MSSTAEVSKRGGLSRKRRIGARALTVVAILFAFVGMLAYFVAHTALDEAGFKTVSQRMIEDDAIRTQVANAVVDGLYGNVDVEAAIANRLPPAQRGLAPVLAGLSRSGAYRAAEAALERPRVLAAWVGVTTGAQRQVVRLLDDKQSFLQTDGGKVVLDLRPIMIQLGDQVAVLGKVADKLPPSAGKVTIANESQLENVRTVTKVLRAVANWMWLVAVAIAAVAIWLARGRRRLELRALGIGVLAVGLLMLATQRGAGGYLVDHLVKNDGAKPAARDAWSILSQVLVDRAWVWITLGVVTLLGVWFLGDSRRASQARRAAQPTLENRWATYGIVVGVLIVLALIAPLFTRGWAISLALVVLAIVGVEVARSTVQREAAQGQLAS
jgi:amino acid transporter